MFVKSSLAPHSYRHKAGPLLQCKCQQFSSGSFPQLVQLRQMLMKGHRNLSRVASKAGVLSTARPLPHQHALVLSILTGQVLQVTPPEPLLVVIVWGNETMMMGLCFPALVPAGIMDFTNHAVGGFAIISTRGRSALYAYSKSIPLKNGSP